MTGDRISQLCALAAKKRREGTATSGSAVWSRGPFRPQMVTPPVPGKIGIGIVCFHDKTEVGRAVRSVLQHGKPEYELVVFDNSPDYEIGTWMVSTHPQVPYMHSEKNTGCWNARNRMTEYLGSRGCEFIVLQDQDVVWLGDAAAPMADVFRQHLATGCVTWRLAIDTMGRHTVSDSGLVWPPEAPGMCCMFRMSALLADEARRGPQLGEHDRDLVGWHHGYGLCYRGDSDVCLSLWTKGYATRVVVDGTCLVAHDAPHRGVAKLGAQRVRENTFSEAVFRKRSAHYGWPNL